MTVETELIINALRRDDNNTRTLRRLAANELERLKAENDRQKAVIEDLRHEIRNLECEKGQLEGTTEYLVEQAKIGAVKEFEGRLTDKADLIKVNAFDSKLVISQEDIDNLVKEMERKEL